MINDYFVNKVELDDQGYANIYVNKFLPYYNEKYLFNDLDRDNKEEALVYDALKLIMESGKSLFGYKKDDIDVEIFNYRIFGQGQTFKGYHVDDYGNQGKMYTVLVYLNGGYDGGEIVFYEDENNFTSYKPKMGDLFYFSGEDAHSVNPVESGKRALISMNLRTPPATTMINC